LGYEIPDVVGLEEHGGYIKNYKRQGLYPKHGMSISSNLEAYGVQAGIYGVTDSGYVGFQKNGDTSFIEFQEGIKKMKYSLLILLSFLLSSLESFCQVDCDHIYKIDSAHNYFSGYSEEPARVIGGYKQLYLISEGLVKRGKIVVQLVVDSIGAPQCIRVIKSDDETLNIRAVKLIEMLEFSPARQKGRNVNSIIVLPISFGKKPKD
jgi:hypothetical protein